MRTRSRRSNLATTWMRVNPTSHWHQLGTVVEQLSARFSRLPINVHLSHTHPSPLVSAGRHASPLLRYPSRCANPQVLLGVCCIGTNSTSTPVLLEFKVGRPYSQLHL